MFQEREQVFLRYLIPHMNRALMLADRMRSLEFKGQACSDAVGTTPMAVLSLDQRRLASVRHLMTLFRLTPAEARLARALACGETLEEYVETSGAKMSTIRTQLRAAFVKTRTDRQSELVRLLQNLPAIRDT